MPLPNCTGGIAGVLQEVGESDFVRRQTARVARRRIRLVAESLLVTARDDSGAGGTAHGGRNIAGRETHTACRQRINARRGEVRIPLKAEVVVAGVVRHN